MKNLKGRQVLVTGAASGIGLECARAFAQRGANLVISDVNATALESARAGIAAMGVKCFARTCDVASEQSVAEFARAVHEAVGPVDVLVNNAGVSDMRGVAPESFDMETWNWIMSIDLNGAFMYLRDVGRHMLESGGGSIVNICSIMGHGANELNVIAYTAAKGALRNLTLQLGCEWADRGVRVNSVSPGFIVTEMVRPALEGMGMDKWIASRTPMRRIGELDEIVGPVMFLASDAASYVTGHDLNVDGGTNAANGYYQIPPIHQEWNADTAPRIGGGYEGIVPRPDWSRFSTT